MGLRPRLIACCVVLDSNVSNTRGARSNPTVSVELCEPRRAWRVGEELQVGVLPPAVVERPVIAEEDNRQIVAIAKRHTVISAIEGGLVVTFAIHPARVFERELSQPALDVVLVLEAELEHLELEHTDGADDRAIRTLGVDGAVSTFTGLEDEVDPDEGGSKQPPPSLECAQWRFLC